MSTFKPVNNDLKKLNPELAKQWHPTKNGNLRPENVSAGSHLKVWWLLPYDDPKTGKHFDFEWEAEVRERNKGMGCPYISGKAVWIGFNDLLTLRPDIAKEWHPVKNKGLKDKKGRDISSPERVSAFSGQKVWWLLPYDDPKTGKHFDFEWEATISKRTIEGSKCPFLTGNKILKGFNDLSTRRPELAKQWHPTKNGKVLPEDVLDNSNKEFWWFVSCADETNNEGKDLEWKESPNRRINKGVYNYSKITNKSQFVNKNNKKIKVNRQSLAELYPELAKQWHPTKNGDLKPEDVTSRTTKKVWWYLPYDDPNTGKHFDFEWENSVLNRVRGNGCPYLAQNPRVWTGFNDLATTNPDIAREWHPTKNGNLLPTQVVAKGYQKIWWYLPYDDPKTGKHFDFEWEATIEHRIKDGRNCPYLTNQKVLQGFNDLATTNPELIEQWHPTKNGKNTPYNIAADSSKKAWWICNKGHEWQSVIHSRNIGVGCPICSSEIRTSSYEFIILYYVKQIDREAKHSCKEFGFELDIFIPSIMSAIEYDGEYWHKDKKIKDKQKNKLCNDLGIVLYRFRENSLGGLDDTSVDIPTNSKSFEKDLQNLLERIFNKKIDVNIERDKADIESLREYMEKKHSLADVHPDLAKEWHPTKNGKLLPQHVTCGSAKKVWWYLPYDDPNTGKHFDFEWEASVSDRNNGAGCPFLSNKAVWPGYNDLDSVNPKLANEWNYKKNHSLTPKQVTAYSGKKVWWMCKNGHEWESVIRNRSMGFGCPYCSGNFKKSNNVVIKMIAQKGINVAPIDDYVNANTPIRFKCLECGFVWKQRLSALLASRGCKKCFPYTESQEKKWNEMLELAKQYYEEKGDLNISPLEFYRGVRLGAWIQNQREMYRNSLLPEGERNKRTGSISPYRVAELRKLGMRW